MGLQHLLNYIIFQSTPSVWRETGVTTEYTDDGADFNPLPPCGGRLCYHPSKCYHTHFNPLPPCGGRPTSIARILGTIHFNPLPPCGGRLRLIDVASVLYISIHSLRVEGDGFTPYDKTGYLDFNPLPPCGGRREICRIRKRAGDFNPLPPCGGRPAAVKMRERILHFNPLPPCGGRRNQGGQSTQRGAISIHSLRVEGDSMKLAQECIWEFQSTPSVWRETHIAPDCAEICCISIHSLRVEGDPPPPCVP